MTIYKSAIQTLPAALLESGMHNPTGQTITRVHRQGDAVHFMVDNHLHVIPADVSVPIRLPYATYAYQLQDGMQIHNATLGTVRVGNVCRSGQLIHFTVMGQNGFKGQANAADLIEIPKPARNVRVIRKYDVVAFDVGKIEKFKTVFLGGLEIEVSRLDLRGLEQRSEGGLNVDVTYGEGIRALHVRPGDHVRIDLQASILVTDIETVDTHTLQLISSAGEGRHLGVHEVIELVSGR